ncbi:MAG: histidine phosphatase family protein [Caulobacter sp.]|nr:histidine phosphatase family protein [Caulobacter sp.]
MALLFITHPEVTVDPAVAVPRWGLSAAGRARMTAFAGSDVVAGVAAVWSSGETKAIEAAAILAGALGLEPRVDEALHENDRSATGFLAPADFELTADAFFARPLESVRGWERAADAQLRIVAAVERCLAVSPAQGDVAVVAHGGVGTLALCHWLGVGIDRARDQPFQGHYWTLADGRALQGWRSIAAR